MSVYNEKKEWVIETIESVLGQTFSEFEFIIIVDSPYNNELINLITDYEIKDSRIILVVNDENIGLASSLNKGIKLSKGELIARIDADDVCMKDRFKKQIEFFEKNPQVDLLGTNINFIDESSHVIERKQEVIISQKIIKKMISYRNVFHHPTWMFKRNILQKIEGYRSFPYSQDYDFVCRCISNEIICTNLTEVLVRYRIRSNSISVSKKYQQGLIVDYIQKLYREQRYCGSDSFSMDVIDSILSEAKNTECKYSESERLYELSKKFLKEKKIYNATKYFFISFLKLPRYRFLRLKNAIIIVLLDKCHGKSISNQGSSERKKNENN